MVTLEAARQMAMSLPETEEKDHFGMPSFRKSSKIFATLWVNDNRMMVKLTPIDQSVFHAFDKAVFYPVPNKWGLEGATFVELDKVRGDMLLDALTVAWESISPPKKKQSK